MKSNGLINLEFEQQTIRMVGTAEDPLWVVADVCRVLGIKNPSDTISRFRDSEKGIVSIYTTRPGDVSQDVNVVNLPGLIRLILRSRKPIAERFQVFILHDVCPSVFKYGCYPPPMVVEGNSAIVKRDDQLAKAIDTLFGMVSALSEKSDERDKVTLAILAAVNRIMPRKEISEVTRAKLRRVLKHMGGWCPCCHMKQLFKGGRFIGEYDHHRGRDKNTVRDCWPICRKCNQDLIDMAFHAEHEVDFIHFQRIRSIILRNKDITQRELFSDSVA